MEAQRTAHLPASPEELSARGWDRPDVLIVSGDASIDHPAFPAALLGRLLESEGLRVAVVPRPEKPEELIPFGVPRLFAAVAPGTMDSMVALYTASKKARSDDPFWPAGAPRPRPPRALVFYCNLLRQAFGKRTLVVAGGVEASMRAFSHYDYWSDSVRRPILLDCGADFLIRGQGEGPLLMLARALAQETPREGLLQLPGLVYKLPASATLDREHVLLPAHEAVAADASSQAEAFVLADRKRAAVLRQVAGGMSVVANPAWRPDSPELLDRVYSLPFTRDVHPCHGVATLPALEQVRFSITSHRGCLGGCAFCSIGAMQGKTVVSRSEQSILDEARAITAHPEFKGVINDLGGPSANMYGSRCRAADCERPSCLHPAPCKHLQPGQERYLDLLRKVAALPGVRHLFVTTGLRADLAVRCPELLAEVALLHTSGYLKAAPEHVSEEVLKLMRKPGRTSFEEFVQRFREVTARAGKKQFVVPYIMVAHPGCRLEHMIELARWLAELELVVEQAQVFTPTPGTAATVMYATGLEPYTKEPVFVERNPRMKQLQKAFALRHLPESREAILEGLRMCRKNGQAAKILGEPPVVEPKGGARCGRT